MRLNRARAIRLKCMDCTGNQEAEVKRCTIRSCTLWRYRMGYEERDADYYSVPSNARNRLPEGSAEQGEEFTTESED